MTATTPSRLDRSPMDHPALLRWIRDAREQIIDTELAEGERVHDLETDRDGTISSESFVAPGYVRVCFDDGQTGDCEPWDLERLGDRRATSRPGPDRRIVRPEDLAAWLDEKGLERGRRAGDPGVGS